MGVRRQMVMITSGFPRISETFALNELIALQRAGAISAIFATKPGDGRPPQPGVEALRGRVELLPDRSIEAQARRVAERVGRGRGRVQGVHAYFAHRPAAVAERAAELLEVPYSFSVHARDIRKVPRVDLNRRARGARCVIACNPDAVAELRASGARAELIPHGVDLSRFAPAPAPVGAPLRLLAVARLVEKKGLEVLLQALAGLDLPFRLRIVGDGPLRPLLERAAAQSGLRGRVELPGTLTHHQLSEAYADANVVVVPSVQDSDGDRDGLPNVVLEAMASGRPVIASRIAAIPAAIQHERTGLLTPPANVPRLREAVERLAADPALRARLGAAARAAVVRDYELGNCTDRLCRCLENAYA
jgi:glycosyltransferase involved in cell wall biosynthesis